MRVFLCCSALLLTASLAAGQTISVQSGGQTVASEASQLLVLSAVNAAATSLDNIEAGLAEESVHGNAVIATGAGVQCEAKDIDGGALPNVVTEGQSSRVACGLNGGLFTVLMNEGGTSDLGAAMATSLSLLDDAVFTDDAAFTPATSKGVVIMGQADDASTDSVDEGDAGALRISLDRLLYTRMTDPCSGGGTKLYLPFDITTATTTEITPSLAGASTHYYICALNIVNGGSANNVNLVDDNTDNCASVTASLISSGVAAGDGWNFAANGGLTIGNGLGSIMRTQTANSVLCLVTSASSELHGQFVVVAAP